MQGDPDRARRHAVSGAAPQRFFCQGTRWRLTTPPGLQIAVNPADYSPSYGMRVACLAIDLSLQVVLSGKLTFEFSIGP